MKRAIRFIWVGIFLLLYCSSCLMPRDKRLWIFGSWEGRKFSDNSKYLFLYTIKNHPEMRAIWLTHSQEVLRELTEKGCEAYNITSIKSFWYSLRAGYVITCTGLNDVNKYTIGSAKKIQLWHGTPLKRLLRDDPLQFPKIYQTTGGLGKLKVNPLRPSNLSIVIAASEQSKRTLVSAFGLDRSKVCITGYPRNDALLDSSLLDNSTNAYLNRVRNQVRPQYIFTYLPTFRDTHRGNPDLFTRFGFETNSIEKTIERLNAVLIIKAHFQDNRLNPLVREESLKRIYFPPDRELPDVYPLLRETDILITDYSSVYFDYLLLNRPIIFAPFDIDEYVREDRGLYYDYDEVTPGPKAKNWPEVFQLIEETLREDRWQQQRKEVCNRFNKFKDSRSSERAFMLIKELFK